MSNSLQMKEHLTTPKSNTPVPPDDPKRNLVITRPNSDQNLSSAID